MARPKRRRLSAVLPILALLFAMPLAGCVPAPRPRLPVTPMLERPVVELTATRFSQLQGWRTGDAAKGLDAFRRSCVVLQQIPPDAELGGAGYAATAGEWNEVCRRAMDLSSPTADAARAFFESAFVPYRVSKGEEGLFTGYYEPELRGSRTRHGPYQTPLYDVPPDLVSIGNAIFRDTAAGQNLAGRMMATLMSMMMVNDRFVPYPTRADIERDGLPATPLFYVDDPIDAFFLQVQGSGRVALDNGTVVRAAYAAQNGQPYTAIGGVLIERGELTREEVSLQSIRAWLLAHPAQAQEVMDANASYVFFSEQPIGDPALGATGAENVPLTPQASLAVDRSVHALGVPAWLEASAPDPDPAKPDRRFDALLVMQDTGGAIRGVVRGDVYWGFGAAAGLTAGRMKHSGRLTVLLPRAVAARLGAQWSAPS
jgi:membrane-bound lytic murein transglycosylase A